jgi:hypothetical protein
MSRWAGEEEAHRSKGTEMTVSRHPINVAVLDDYQGVADFFRLETTADISAG